MGNAKVLFLCTGNSARSQMAEALLRRYAGDQFEVYSAGLEPKGINPYTVQVMTEVGLDLSQHTSKDVFQYLGHVNFGYIITVCSNAEARCPIFPGISYRLYWPFDDPAAVEGTDDEKLVKFREVRDQIDERIRVWLSEQHITPVDSTSQAA
jgi:arsenate reductase (thioredoxin)